MEKIQWRSELNTGIDKVDEDHRYLIELTNDLIQAIDKDVTKEELLSIFDELESYTVYHFNREEAYLHEENIHLPETLKYIKHHKAQHRYFINRLPELKERLMKSDEKSVAYDTVEFLLEWLLDHIIKEDLRINQFLEQEKLAQKKLSLPMRIIISIKKYTNLQQRFFIIFAIPIFFLVLQSAFVSHKAYTKYLEREKIQNITKSIIRINSSITQLQKERGLSSAYISSGYTHFKRELELQRHYTSEAIKRNFSSKEIVEHYIDIEKGLSTLKRLPKIREEIDKKILSKDESIRYYTNFISILIDIIKKISYLPFNTVDKHTYSPLILLMNLNEIHGLIRNEGMSCLETGEHNCPHLEALFVRKKAYEEAFDRIATKEMQEALQEIKLKPITQSVCQLRNAILDQDISGHQAAQKWFSLTSKWIDTYNEIIQKSLEKINRNALVEKEAFATIIQRIWIILIIMIVFISISIYLLKESIIHPLEEITKALHRLSSGDKSIFFTTLTYKDAISRMERAYNQLRNSLIKADYANILMYLQKKKTQTYAKLSDEDALTGINNRRAFMRQLELITHEATLNNTPVSLCILDIDHFKRINDTYGHDTGDVLLKAFAHNVHISLRQGDIFARIGGEEFALLLPHTPYKTGCKVAQRIIETIASLRFEDIDPNLHMTVSIGMAAYSPGMDIKAFLHEADQKLYQAKREGRNRVVC